MSMETKGTEDELSAVVETRLERINKEQASLRNAVFHRLAQREAALNKFAQTQSRRSRGFTSQREEGGAINTALLTPTDSKTSLDSATAGNNNYSHQQHGVTLEGGGGGVNHHRLLSSSSVGQKEEEETARPPGPWKASQHSNIQLERVKAIRMAEETKLRLLHPQMMRDQKKEETRKTKQRKIALKKKSEFVRDVVLQSEKERKKRNEENRREAVQAQERVLRRVQKMNSARRSYMEGEKTALRRKKYQRRRREMRAHTLREKNLKQREKKSEELYGRMERTMEMVQQRLLEKKRVEENQTKQRDEGHRARVEQHLKMMQEGHEAALREREEQRAMLLVSQEEEKRKELVLVANRKLERRLEAERRRREQEHLHLRRKKKMQAHTDQRLRAIEVEQERKKYLAETLHDQLRAPSAEFRTMASKLLDNIGDIRDVEELKKVKLLLETQFQEISEQQRVESWDVYTAAIDPRGSPRPGTSSRPSTARRGSPFGSSFVGSSPSRPSTTKSSRYRRSPSRSSRTPTRPSSSSAGSRPTVAGSPSPGRRHRSVRPQTASFSPRKMLGSSRRCKICSLCRGSFGELPHRVLRKAVLDARASIGVPQHNQQRWRTAVYYDLVSVCVMCKQFVSSDYDGLSRYLTNVPIGPVRKTTKEVEKDNELRMIQLIQKKKQDKEQYRGGGGGGEGGGSGGGGEDGTRESSSSATQDGTSKNSNSKEKVENVVVITVRVG